MDTAESTAPVRTAAWTPPAARERLGGIDRGPSGGPALDGSPA